MMMNNTFTMTSVFGALFMTISLKLLHVFKFIEWSPVGWTKKWPVFLQLHFSIKWILLFAAIVIIFALIYLIVSFVETVPPSVSALFISFVGIYLVYKSIGEPKTFLQTMRAVSIPFFAVTAMVLRFITGTAVFMRQLSRKV